MSQNCNTIIDFDTHTLEKKRSLGRSASIAIHSALSTAYKAIETLETRQASTGAEVVYLRAALGKLQAAAQAVRGMREILVTGELSSTASEWLSALDYDRMFHSGVADRRIPASREQWDRLVGMTTSLNHLAVTDCLLADLSDLEGELGSSIHSLLSGTPGDALSSEQIQHLFAIQSALLQFATFAQMVAYMNAIEPLDEFWIRRVDTLSFASADHKAG